MTNTQITRVVKLSSPLVSPRPSAPLVYAGKRIRNTKAGDIDSLLLYTGLSDIEAIDDVAIGQDGLSLRLTLLVKHVDTPVKMATFIAATDALLRRCADDPNSKLFPELAPGTDLTTSFELQ